MTRNRVAVWCGVVALPLLLLIPMYRELLLTYSPLYGALAIVVGLSVAVDQRTGREHLWPMALGLFLCSLGIGFLYETHYFPTDYTGALAAGIGFSLALTAFAVWASRWLLIPGPAFLGTVATTAGLTFVIAPLCALPALLNLAVLTGDGI